MSSPEFTRLAQYPFRDLTLWGFVLAVLVLGVVVGVLNTDARTRRLERLL